MKTTRHSLMAKGIMVLLALLVLVFAFTYSWYVERPKVTASGISAEALMSGDFEYAVGFSNSQTGGSYKHTEFTNESNNNLNLEELYASDDPQHTKPINILYDYTPIDVTGNGVRLIRPAMNYGNWNINEASANYSDAEENVQYVSFDLIFRTQMSGAVVKLDSDSVAKATCEEHSGDGNLVGAPSGTSGVSTGSNHSYNYNALTNPDNQNSNKYGRFSRDAIVGAVRVAFLNYTNDGTLTANDIVTTEQSSYESVPALLWVPRPDIFLNNGATSNMTVENQLARDGMTDGWTLQTGLSDQTRLLASKALYSTTYRTYDHQYYNIFEQAQGSRSVVTTYEAAIPSVLDTSASGDKVTFGHQMNVVDLDLINDTNNDNAPDDGYYYGKVRVRIWLEGTDSESRRALAGGSFNISFHFTA